jgi:YbbR domain-containing protein
MLVKKNFFSYLLVDWIAKILCLIIAIMLYVFFQFNSLRDRAVSVPLTVITNDELVPASQYPRTIRLVLRGASDRIYSIQENDLEAILDLGSHNTPGTWRVPVRIHKRGSALSVDPLTISLEPSEVSIVLETKSSRQLKIVPEFRGTLESGYELVSVEVVPPFIDAVGPLSVLDNVREALTDPVDLSGRKENFVNRVRVLKAETTINYTASEFVEVRVTVRREILYKSYTRLPVALKGLMPELRLIGEAPLVSARLGSSRRIMETFMPALGLISLDLSDIREPGTYLVPITGNPPDEMTLDMVDPPVISVTVEWRDVSGSRP